jgi:hypothetical protein
MGAATSIAPRSDRRPILELLMVGNRWAIDIGA